MITNEEADDLVHMAVFWTFVAWFVGLVMGCNLACAQPPRRSIFGPPAAKVEAPTPQPPPDRTVRAGPRRSAPVRARPRQDPEPQSDGFENFVGTPAQPQSIDEGVQREVTPNWQERPQEDYLPWRDRSGSQLLPGDELQGGGCVTGRVVGGTYEVSLPGGGRVYLPPSAVRLHPKLMYRRQPWRIRCTESRARVMTYGSGRQGSIGNQAKGRR